MNRKYIYSLSLILLSSALIAKENIYSPATTVINTRVASGCAPSITKTDLDVNNVRTTIILDGTGSLHGPAAAAEKAEE